MIMACAPFLDIDCHMLRDHFETLCTLDINTCVRSLTYTCWLFLCSAAHEHDKVAWAVEKQAFEVHVQQLTDEGEGLRNDIKAKGVELEELAKAKQKMMEDYEQNIAQQTEAFEARISTLESERNELLEYKVTL